MITMLKTGLTQACSTDDQTKNIDFKNMKVNKISTGAQQDDIHCGAWTVQHIQDIATSGQVLTPTYTKKDKDTVVKKIADLANLELIPKKSLLARLFPKLFGSRSKTADAAVSSAPHSNILPDGHFEVDDSYRIMQNGLEKESTGKTPQAEALRENSTVEAGSDGVEVNPNPNNTPRI